MAVLLYVFCQETFKAYTETVKRTYWPHYAQSDCLYFTWLRYSSCVAELVAAALLWQSWVTLAMFTHRPRADGHRRADRGREGERGRGRKQPRVNSAPWTATIRHLSRQHLFAFIFRRWITYSRQSQRWINTLVWNVTIIGMLSQVPHSVLSPSFSPFYFFWLLLHCSTVQKWINNEFILVHFWALDHIMSAVVFNFINYSSESDNNSPSSSLLMASKLLPSLSVTN